MLMVSVSLFTKEPFCAFLSSVTLFVPAIENLPTDGNEANGHQGFLEKNLSDFFDI